MGDVQTFLFEDDGRIPNNPTLPLLICPAVLPDSRAPASDCRSLFARNGWDGSWVDGIYDYHHFHSTAHEVLGIVGGSASVQFGGEKGKVLELKAGDVAIIPAGVGHCNLGQSDDFKVVGAYPKGQEKWDVCTGKPGERPIVDENIRHVPLPTADPVSGENGPLMRLWQIP